MPFYQYEHLLGYAHVQRHVAKEITLLCHQHHGEKTNGLLPVEAVIEADKNPLNLRAGVSRPYNLHYSGHECEVLIGSNLFTTTDDGTGNQIIAIMVDGVPLVSFDLEDGHLLLNLTLYDHQNDVVMVIKRNILIYSSNPWDIQLVGRNLIIREAARSIFIDMTFEVPNKIAINRGRLLCNGVEVLVKPDHCLLTNNSMVIANNLSKGVACGLNLGRIAPIRSALEFSGIPRYLGDNSDAIRWAKEALSFIPNGAETGLNLHGGDLT